MPALAFTAAPQHGQALSSGEFYAIQHVLPVHLVVPPALGVILGLLAAIDSGALWLMGARGLAPGAEPDPAAQ